LSAPRQLGKYRILEVLGKGAMGVVYKGFDPVIEREVALKTIRKELLDREHAVNIVARFKREAQAGGRLTHPGIVAVYEYGEDEQTAYIAMEYIPGRGLGHYLAKQGRFSLQDTMNIMRQLLGALGYAHQKGIVHRDIKPANLIVLPDGGLKIADFGIARLDNSSFTQIGAMIGTPSYMSPEQFAGLTADGRSDLFSAAVILYELLTGAKPFQGATETISYKICHEAHRNPSEIEPGGSSPVFDNVLAKALAKKADERFQTAKDFLDALEKAYAGRDCEIPDLEPTLYNDAPPPPHERVDSTTNPPSNWPLEPLRAIEQLLAPHVGPMARVLVKRAAKDTVEGFQLVSRLAEHIANEEDRKSFAAASLAKVAGVTGTGTGTATRSHAAASRSGSTSQGTLDPVEIDKATKALTAYIGPIAKVMAKKAASAASGRGDFYERLAASIGDIDDRSRFLQEMGQA
jgi:eukaryotic-like serine/threonine-protein kinase